MGRISKMRHPLPAESYKTPVYNRLSAVSHEPIGTIRKYDWNTRAYRPILVLCSAAAGPLLLPDPYQDKGTP